jgi:VCBS repeat-containing protein
MDFLTFELDEVDDGVSSLEAMASTAAGQHGAVMAEVQQVLDWAWSRFPKSHGPIDDGMDWDHDLQVSIEDGGWHTVTLTLTGTGRFVEEFNATFGSAGD